jgi:hypothetical protein
VLAAPLSTDQLMRLFEKKFRRHLTPERLRYFRRSLTDFSLAEATITPTMLKTAGPSWQVIKRHLTKWASE